MKGLEKFEPEASYHIVNHAVRSENLFRSEQWFYQQSTFTPHYWRKHPLVHYQLYKSLRHKSKNGINQ